ncbi:MAG TPA: hypothetical protein DEF47_18600 [Herpetosiphon sp.]|nr:hypothetical protein [Herpetosiphon sp.]
MKQERECIIKDLGSFAERNYEFRKSYTITKSSIFMPSPPDPLAHPRGEGEPSMMMIGTPLALHRGSGVGGEGA